MTQPYPFPDRDGELRLLVDEGLSRPEIAEAMELGFHTVRNRLDMLGLRTKLGAARMDRACVKAVQKTDAELIAEAVAAGKVTRLPPGQAAGLTTWEGALWVAGANSTASWKALQVNRNKNAGTLK